MRYAKPFEDLIEEFRKFPTIGPKSAQRMAFTLLRKPNDQIEKFIRVISDAKYHLKNCKFCFNLSAEEICPICDNSQREHNQICVVESVKDLIAIENTSEYHGLYHVLGGVISPLDGLGAEDLNIQELILRINAMDLDDLEIILALGLSTEGEATMLYLKRLLEAQAKNIKITRLAHGLPVGADLDYTDQTTLSKALEARVLVS
ncbi:MAG: recombination mediator RecR [Candidatus Caenarcaniphilales bacterium]|jgi:recombination protein RecR|nr:recombination mediator RecR [Candidatus Caenarcaniphilales bacterium]